MGRGTSLGSLPPLGKPSASLERLGWEVLGDQWCGMASHKLQNYCTVSGRVPKVFWLTVFSKGGELRNWMLEQPINNKGCSLHFQKYKKFFRVSVSWYIRKFCFLKYNKFFQDFSFPEYKKSFLLRKYKKFFNIRARKFHFPKHKEFF